MDDNMAIEAVPRLLAKTDRELLEAIYLQQEQLGLQINWLCENLAQVFGVVQAMGQNGGGIRGLMKMMKEVNNGQSES